LNIRREKRAAKITRAKFMDLSSSENAEALKIGDY